MYILKLFSSQNTYMHNPSSYLKMLSLYGKSLISCTLSPRHPTAHYTGYHSVYLYEIVSALFYCTFTIVLHMRVGIYCQICVVLC